jgi:hypothetical protein
MITKGKFKDGTPYVEIRISILVTKIVFAKALADHYWTNNEPFDIDIGRREAVTILKNQLSLKGREGIETDHWESAAESFVEVHNAIYEQASEWIEKNYPYLS